MILRMLMVLLALFPFTSSLEAGVFDWFGKKTQPQPPKIKILIVHDKPEVILEVKGKYHLFDPNKNEHISTRFVGKRKLVQPISGGLKWGEEFPGLHQIMIAPSPTTTTVVDGVEYQGGIYVYDIGGSISVVNELDIEDYLSSMLIPRYQEPLPEEVLSAIAIAARTNAYFQALNPKNQYWALDGTKIGYHGLVIPNQESEMAKSIDATHYMVMSRTGLYEGTVTPFLAQWDSVPSLPSKDQPVQAKISLAEAERFASQGEHAAQILAKAFPGTTIQLMQYAPVAAWTE
jgi:stage II sporulation protein D